MCLIILPYYYSEEWESVACALFPHDLLTEIEDVADYHEVLPQYITEMQQGSSALEFLSH